MKNVNKVLKMLKDERHISYRKMAKDLDVSLSTIQRWINGEASPDHGNLENISKVYDIDFNFLTGEINEDLTILANQRSNADGRRGLKEFIISRGFEPEIIDSLSDSQLYDIEYIITYMAKNPTESVLDNMANNIQDLLKRIKQLEDNSSK